MLLPLRYVVSFCLLLALKPISADDHPAPSDPTLPTEYGSVPMLPADNDWNRPIAHLPVHPMSDVWIASVGLDKPLHPDFGDMWEGAPMGIPYVVLPADQPAVAVTFRYADESDPGLYPVPDDAPIEGGPDADGDRHVLIVDARHRKLYELYRAFKTDLGWQAESGAIFDLTANAPRPLYWTSADAAGLPILPGLVRYDEAAETKAIRHAVRFTVRKTQRGFIYPARHFASPSENANLPPMGMRVRLKADFDVTPFPPEVQVILRGLQQYGMILADNGSDWFLSGTHDPRWDSEVLSTIKRVKGRDLEVVYTGEITK